MVSPTSAPPEPVQLAATSVTLTLTYVTSGPTAKPTLPGSVHGVVVHAKIDESSSINLNFT